MSSFSRKFARHEARAARRNAARKQTFSVNVPCDGGPAVMQPALLTPLDFKHHILNLDFNEPFINMVFTDQHVLTASSPGDGTATLQAVPRDAHAAMGKTLHDHHADPQTAAEYAARGAVINDALSPFETVTLTREDVEDPKRFDALYARALLLEDERPAA